jgi:FAD/FMN-containing dehydrogenase
VNQLTGRVLKCTDPGWDDARHGFGARFDYDSNQPSAIVFVENTQDVVNAVKFARSAGLPLRARCGRHNYQGYSSLVKGGIIVDVSELDQVSVSLDRTVATVGAGLDMLTLTEKLADVGLGLPLATGPSVGLAGLIQGGGFGITTRRYGLMCDNVIGCEVVDANGVILEVSATSHPDLFWALRGGGGGNFGIVTRFTLTPYPIGMVGLFNLTWQWSDFEAVVDKWQRWNFAAPVALTSLLTLHVDGTVRVEGQFTPDPEELPTLGAVLAPMLTAPTPISVQSMTVPSIIAARMTFGVAPAAPEWAIKPHVDKQLFKSTSAIAKEFMPAEGIASMKKWLESVPPLSAAPSQPSMIQLLGGGGGKATEVAADATAVFHRDVALVVQYDGYWTAPEDAQPTIDWVIAMRKSLFPYAQGAYVNYQDDSLGDDWLEQYYGGNLPRLRKIKRQYDPTNFFSFPQSIPPA